MYPVKAILMILWLAVIPVCIGMLFTRKIQKENNSLKAAALCGYAVMFALFELLALPMIFAKASFHSLCWVYGGCLVLLVAAAVFINVKSGGEIFRGWLAGFKKMPWTMYLALLLIAVQVGAYLIFRMDDLDDAFYVATATTTVHTNSMFQFDAYTGDLLKRLPSRYILSPFPIFLAFLSEGIGMQPAVMAHTLMPLFLIPLAYMVYHLIGQKLFHGDRKSVGLFLCFLSLVHMFSYYSVYTQGTFMLIRIWQGKAVLAGILLPALFYLCIRVFKEEGSRAEWLLLLITLIACCLVSSMGIMLAPVMVGIFAVLYGVFGRNGKKFAGAVLCCIPCLVCAGIYIMIR